MASKRKPAGSGTTPPVRPIALSELLGLPATALDEKGAFDAVLNADTPLFIDPALLRGCKIPELAGSHHRVHEHFRKLLLVLQQCDKQDDIWWQQAEKMLTFPEAQSLCIGYARGKTSGRGSGKGIRDELLMTAVQIIAAGLKEPEIFEIMGLLQPNVGPDRISDMTAGIIIEDLKSYTSRILTDLRAKEATPAIPLQWVGGLPLNPFNNKPIILAPWGLLDDLPMALDRSTYGDSGAGRYLDEGKARAVREATNGVIRDAWMTATPDKKAMRGALLQNPDLIAELLRRYRQRKARPYDFQRDPRGYLAWNRIANQIAREFPLPLTLPANHTADDIEELAIRICDHFKELVENNGVWKSFYGPDGNHLHEGYAQRTLYCIADVYCRIANVGITPEANGGRGPVDFKLSTTYDASVLIEVKLTTNQRLCHGYTTQIELYAKAEHTSRTIYLVIDIDGCPDSRYEQFDKIRKTQTKKYPIVKWVDAQRKDSASVA
jgi:hypothetical protein